MEFVVLINGKVNHPLTIDPTVWIFDERKVDLHTYFDEQVEKEDEIEAYTKAISAQWDREITEGAQLPEPNKTNEIKYKKQELITGSFGMPFQPFLFNAEPTADASTVTVETAHQQTLTFTIEEAQTFIFGFSKDGNALRDNGPIHIYYGDGSNKNNPITDVKRIIIS